MNKYKQYGVSSELFASGYSDENYQALRSVAHDEVSQFMDGIDNGAIVIDDDLMPQSAKPHLDEWVEQNDGLLAELVHDVHDQIFDIIQNILPAHNKHPLPAHDERQVCFKDPAEAMRFYFMEKPQGYKAAFVITMNLHDWGRLLESLLYDPIQNPPNNWIPHAQLSFLLLKRTLEQPKYESMPQELKNHLLYAVLAHSGDNGKSYMSRAVQTCDRMQLIGAEGFYRALSYGTCLSDAHIKYPDDAAYQQNLPDMYENTSVLSMLEYCARNMRENIGNNHEEWQNRIAIENVVLLLAACEGNPDLAQRIFAPENEVDCLYGPKKGRINLSVYADAAEIYKSLNKPSYLQYSPYELSENAIRAIEAPIGAAKLSDDMKKSLRNAVGNMSEIERKSLAHTLIIADKYRQEQDALDLDICRQLESDPRQFVAAIAKSIRRFTPEAPTVNINRVAAVLPVAQFSGGLAPA